jgi:hypothetical protein
MALWLEADANTAAVAALAAAVARESVSTRVTHLLHGLSEGDRAAVIKGLN